MVSADELAELSRYLAGDASPAEALVLEARLAKDPALRQACERLRQLERVAVSAPTSLEPAALERLVARVRRPRPAARRGPLLALAALLLAALAAGLTLGRSSATVTALRAPVRLNGVELAAGASLALSEGDRLDCGPGAASIAEGARQWLVPAGAALIWGPRPRLVRGAALVRGELVLLRASSLELEASGLAAVVMEPEAEAARVNEVLARLSPEDLVKDGWLKLGVPSLAVAAVAGATIFVLEGEASVSGDAAADAGVHLRAGERYAEATGHVSALGAGPALAAAASPGVSAPAPAGLSGEAAQQEIARLQRELDATTQKLRFTEALLQGLHKNVDPREKQPWPEGMPESHRPEAFRKLVEVMEARCPTIGKADAVLCDEPPCIVALHGGDGKLGSVLECAAWIEAYGDSHALSGSSRTVSCDGGVGVQVQLISPHWEGWENEDPAYARAVTQRLDKRWNTYVETLCQ